MPARPSTAQLPLPNTRMSEASRLYATMTRVRAFEERVARHFRSGEIHGFVHLSIGQEAVAAGTCSVLEPDDYITTTHRGHGHCIAKGADPGAMMAELFGRASGLCGGKGGSMHLADPTLRILGANGIVGAGIPIAAGAALASQIHAGGQVAVAFFGEGALHTGAFHEACCLAVAWRLPLLLVCDSNGWAEFTPAAAWGGPDPASRASSYGMPSECIDGTNVVLVRDTVRQIVEGVRSGNGPAFLEMKTVRAHGHYEGDAQLYRDEDARAWRDRDPLRCSPEPLGLSDEEAAALARRADEEMDAAVEAALLAPYPDADAVLRDVYA